MINELKVNKDIFNGERKVIKKRKVEINTQKALKMQGI